MIHFLEGQDKLATQTVFMKLHNSSSSLQSPYSKIESILLPLLFKFLHMFNIVTRHLSR